MTIQRRFTAATRTHLIGILYVLAAVVIWSTVPVGTRILMRGSSAFSAAFISAARLWVAALVFLLIHAIYCRRAHRPFRIAVEHKGWLFIAAASLCINYIFYAVGLRYTTASATSIVSQVNAIATVLLAALLLGERVTRQKLLGMALAVIGVLLVLFHGASLRDLLASQYFTGNIIEIIGGLVWPFYAIGQTKLMEGTKTQQILMPIFGIAAVLSLLLLPFTGPLITHAPTFWDWGVLLFLGLVSTAAAYWLFAAGLQRIETSVGAMFNVLIPLFALLMAHWMLDEPVHANIIFGLALVIGGLGCIAWRRSHSPVR